MNISSFAHAAAVADVSHLLLMWVFCITAVFPCFFLEQGKLAGSKS